MLTQFEPSKRMNPLLPLAACTSGHVQPAWTNCSAFALQKGAGGGAGAPAGAAAPEAIEAEGAADEDEDVLRYGPRPDQLVAKTGGVVVEAAAVGEPLERGSGLGSGTGVYRPPKINPVSMDTCVGGGLPGCMLGHCWLWAPLVGSGSGEWWSVLSHCICSWPLR